MFVLLKTIQTCQQKSCVESSGCFIYNLLIIIIIIIIIIIFNKRVWGCGGMGLSGEGRA